MVEFPCGSARKAPPLQEAAQYLQFSMFGYITATLATFFIGREADSDESELAMLKSIQSLRDEVVPLRSEIRELKKDP